MLCPSLKILALLRRSLVFFFFAIFFLFKMAATSFKEAYSAVFSNRLEQLKDATTVDEVRKLYDDWATKYNKVRLLVLATAYLEQRCH